MTQSYTLRVVTVAILAIVVAGFADAQATRTWVSGVGDDANPCSRTAPCKTFAGAISKTASFGEISVLDPGGFGAVTVTKSIVINGTGTLASALASGTNGVIINAAGAVVTLRNLQISGGGSSAGLTGVRILAAKSVVIEDCAIEYFTGGTAPAGIVVAAGANVSVSIRNTHISKCGTGVLIANTAGQAQVLISESSATENQAGLTISPASPGTGTARVTVNNCVFSNNTSTGVSARARGKAMLDHCVVSGSSTGVLSYQSIRLSETVVTENGTGLAAFGSGEILSFGNNRVYGNNANGSFSSVIGLQ